MATAVAGRPQGQILTWFRGLTDGEDTVRWEAARGIATEGDGYAWRRLVRGTASSREKAREGFSLALTTALRAEAIGFDDVKRLVSEELKIEGSSRDAREARLGRVFCIAALVRSGELGKDSERVGWALKSLQSAAGTERGLADSALALAAEIIRSTGTVPKLNFAKQCEAWLGRDTPDAAALRVLLKKEEAASTVPQLMKWFEHGFIMEDAPVCWRIVIEEAGKRGGLPELWSQGIEPQLLRSKAQEKRKMGLRLVPVAVAACRNASDVDAILSKRTVQSFRSAKGGAQQLASAVQRTNAKALPSVARVMGRLGGFDDVVSAAASRMKEAQLSLFITEASGWEKTKAVSALSSVWKASGDWDEKAAAALCKLGAQSTAVRLAAERGYHVLENLFQLAVSDFDAVPREGLNSQQKAELVLQYGVGLCDADLDIEDQNVPDAIAVALLIPSAALRALAEVAWRLVIPDLEWNAVEALLGVLKGPAGADGPAEGEEGEEDDEDDGLEDDEEGGNNDGGDDEDDDEDDGDDDDDDEDDEDGDDDAVDDDLDAAMKGRDTDGQPAADEDGVEAEGTFLTDMDMDDEDPAVLERYDQMLGNVIKHVRSTEKQRSRRMAEVRSQASLKALDLVAMFVAAARKRRVGLDCVIKFVPHLLSVAVSDGAASTKAQGMLTRKILRGPAEFAGCSELAIEEALVETMDVVTAHEASSQSALCERAVLFLFAVAQKAGVSSDITSREFVRGWQQFISSRRDIGLSSTFGASLAAASPDLLRRNFEFVAESATQARSAFVAGAALTALTETLERSKEQGAGNYHSNCRAAESVFCTLAEAEGQRYKAARARELLELGQQLASTSYPDKGVARLLVAVRAVEQWDVCKSKTALKETCASLKRDLDTGLPEPRRSKRLRK